MEICRSPESDIWIPILLVYKALYLIVGVFLAVQTYNVKLKRLRDSKLIVACVCTVCVAALVGSIVGLAVPDPTTAYGVYGFFILLVVTVILLVLFGTLVREWVWSCTVSLVAGSQCLYNAGGLCTWE